MVKYLHYQLKRPLKGKLNPYPTACGLSFRHMEKHRRLTRNPLGVTCPKCLSVLMRKGMITAEDYPEFCEGDLVTIGHSFLFFSVVRVNNLTCTITNSRKVRRVHKPRLLKIPKSRYKTLSKETYDLIAKTGECPVYLRRVIVKAQIHEFRDGKWNPLFSAYTRDLKIF